MTRTAASSSWISAESARCARPYGSARAHHRMGSPGKLIDVIPSSTDSFVIPTGLTARRAAEPGGLPGTAGGGKATPQPRA